MSLFPWLLIFMTLLFSPGSERVQKSSIPESISEWIKAAPPKVGSDAWRAANASDYEWQVGMKNGLPVAHRRSPKTEEGSALPLVVKRAHGAHDEPGEIHSVQVTDGWLVAYNAGEFGGSLWWYGADGRQRYKVSNDQINQFLPTKRGGLFALEGVAHMNLSRGQIVQIKQNAQGQWMSTQFVDLGHAPDVGLIDRDGNFIVSATDALIKVQPDKTQKVLIEKAFWAGLYPHSIALSPSGDIYLGMRHGVSLIYPFNHAYVAEWFLPNRDFVRAKPKD